MCVNEVLNPILLKNYIISYGYVKKEEGRVAYEITLKISGLSIWWSPVSSSKPLFVNLKKNIILRYILMS